MNDWLAFIRQDDFDFDCEMMVCSLQPHSAAHLNSNLIVLWPCDKAFAWWFIELDFPWWMQTNLEMKVKWNFSSTNFVPLKGQQVKLIQSATSVMHLKYLSVLICAPRLNTRLFWNWPCISRCQKGLNLRKICNVEIKMANFSPTLWPDAQEWPCQRTHTYFSIFLGSQKFCLD